MSVRSNNLFSYCSGSPQSQNAVYWKTGSQGSATIYWCILPGM